MFYHRPRKLTVGKWHFVAGCQRSYEYRLQGWYEIDFAIFRLNEMPPVGAMTTRKHYTGFWLRFAILVPFVLR